MTFFVINKWHRVKYSTLNQDYNEFINFKINKFDASYSYVNVF